MKIGKNVLWGIRLLSVVLLGLVNITVSAIEVDITAEFKPSFSKTSSPKIVNTTPLSGYCARFPSYCSNGISSVSFNHIGAYGKLFNAASEDARQHLFIALDATEKRVTLTNTRTGEQKTLLWRLNLVDVEYKDLSGVNLGTVFKGPQGGCSAATGYGDNNKYHFAWHYSDAKYTACYGKLSGTEQTEAMISQVGFGYKIVPPDPLTLSNGTWTGSVKYTLGKGQQIDFGEVTGYPDSQITFNLFLDVEHQLLVTQPAGMDKVELTPPGGWSRWSGRAVQRLESSSSLLISSSGPFAVQLKCEFVSGQNCAIANINDSSLQAPVSLSITIPNVEHKGRAVNNLRLNQSEQIVFNSLNYGHERMTRLNFDVTDEGVKTMLKHPGSEWRGRITLFFDAEI